MLLVASHADPVDPVNYYNRARAASNPHARLRNPDAADWHKPRVRPVSLRFEGLTQAYLALFLVVAWLEVLTVWAFTFLGVLANPGSLSSGRVAVAVLWLKNLLAALLLSWVYLGLASTRLLLATDPLTLLG